MSNAIETPDDNVEVITAKRRIVLPRIPVRKALVTTLAVVGGVSLAKVAVSKLHRGEDDSDDNVTVETSEV